MSTKNKLYRVKKGDKYYNLPQDMSVNIAKKGEV